MVTSNVNFHNRLSGFKNIDWYKILQTKLPQDCSRCSPNLWKYGINSKELHNPVHYISVKINDRISRTFIPMFIRARIVNTEGVWMGLRKYVSPFPMGSPHKTSHWWMMTRIFNLVSLRMKKLNLGYVIWEQQLDGPIKIQTMWIMQLWIMSETLSPQGQLKDTREVIHMVLLNN